MMLFHLKQKNIGVKILKSIALLVNVRYSHGPSLNVLFVVRVVDILWGDQRGKWTFSPHDELVILASRLGLVLYQTIIRYAPKFCFREKCRSQSVIFWLFWQLGVTECVGLFANRKVLKKWFSLLQIGIRSMHLSQVK